MGRKKPRKKAGKKENIVEEIVTKRNIKRLVIGITAGVIIFFVLSFFLGIRVHFLLNQEMNIGLSPLEKSFNIAYDDPPMVTFKVDVNNPVVCKSTCNYELKDLRTNEKIYENSGEPIEDQSFTYKLPINAKGEGQALFNFKVGCHNIKTTVCSTKEKVFYKTAIVSVNYGLPDDELSKKQELEVSLPAFAEEIKIIDMDLQKNNLLLGRLTDSVEKKTLLKKFDSINSELISLSDKYTQILQLWRENEFNKVFSFFNDKIKSLSSSVIVNNAESTNLLISIMDGYNRDIDVLDSLLAIDLTSAEIFYTKTQENTLYSIRNISHKINNLARDLELEKITSFDSITSRVQNLNKETKEIIQQYEDDINAFTYASSNAVNDTKQSFFSMTRLSMNISTHAKNFSEACDMISSSLNKIHTFNSRINISSNYDFINKSLMDSFIELYYNFTLTNLSSFSLNQSKYENTSTEHPINITIENSTVFNMSSVDFTDLGQINNSKLIALHSICIKDAQNTITQKEYNLKKMSSVIANSSIKSNISTDIPEVSPECCLGEVCDKCCKEGECKENYPIVFVHGHLFNEKNSPEETLASFAKIQNKLEEEGFVNAGQITADSTLSDIPSGDWGRINAPISVRVSYYFISYIEVGKYSIASQKSDRIENYAIRLKELIDIIKHRTGKDKVNIVSHSMGGLVSREYMALFGEGNVNKLIMIGTPNKGITGKVSSSCSIIGSSKECKDMEESSIFLKRLNLETKTLKDVKSYTIRASGCDMEGEDGDGIALKRNVPLDFATNYEIKGECTDLFKTDLHSNMLDPDLYPQTYSIIKQILTE